MDALKFESQSGRQTALALASLAVGITLAYGFRHFDGSGMTNSLAGFMLGMLLLVIGLAGLLARGKQTIVVDPRLHRIIVDDAYLFGTRKKMIPFNEIAGTGLGFIGKKSNFVGFYYINLKLKNGAEFPLFSPGRFFEGGSDRSVMERRRQQLEAYIKQ